MERLACDVAVVGASAAGGFDFLWPAAIERPAESVRRRLPGVRLRSAAGRGPVVDEIRSLPRLAAAWARG